MNKTTNTSIPTLAPLFRFQWEEAQQCFVILYPEGMVQLSTSAGEIMNMIDGTKNLGSISQALSDKFDGIDLHQDVMAFVTEAHKNGWIELN